MIPFLQNINRFIESFSDWLGRTVSWCSLFLVLLVFVIAVMRYIFKIGSIPLQETVIYLHGFLFMLTAGYTLAKDEHVRVDVFYARLPKRSKHWINLVGVVLFLMPLCWFVFSYSWDYVSLSWRVQESSPESGGLPYLFLLKSLLVAMPVLLALQGLHLFLTSLSGLTRQTKASDTSDA